ncbi:hypothetical protein GCM10023100_56510 [Actinocorallia cavernae]|uniref:Uncharacterized protein n=2 Tax=Actinomycetes TaxID=1760 RepID=A0ABP8T070_9ACTN
MYPTPSASSRLIALRHFEQAGLIQISMAPTVRENPFTTPVPEAPKALVARAFCQWSAVE